MELKLKHILLTRDEHPDAYVEPMTERAQRELLRLDHLAGRFAAAKWCALQWSHPEERTNVDTYNYADAVLMSRKARQRADRASTTMFARVARLELVMPHGWRALLPSYYPRGGRTIRRLPPVKQNADR